MGYSSGDSIPLWVNKDITANAPTAQIKRLSDGYYLDFNDNAFKNAAWTTPTVTLSDVTNQWRYQWDSTALASSEAACVIEYTVDGTVYSDSLDMNFSASSTAPTAEQNAAAVRVELATELGRVDAAVSTRATPAQVQTECEEALTAYGAATAADISTQVQSALTTYDAATGADITALGTSGVTIDLTTITSKLDGIRNILEIIRSVIWKKK